MVDMSEEYALRNLHPNESRRMAHVIYLLSEKVGWLPDGTQVTLLPWQVDWIRFQLQLADAPAGRLFDYGRLGGKTVALYTLWRYDCILNNRRLE